MAFKRSSEFSHGVKGAAYGYILALLRLLVIPLMCRSVLILAGMPAEHIAIITLFLALPLGLNMVIFPASVGKDTKPRAAMALISSLFSVGTLPFIIEMIA